MLFLYLFFVIFHAYFCANILVYSPTIATSHMNFMAHLADTLTEVGHNVTFLVPISDASRRDHSKVKITKDVYIVEQDEEMKMNVPVIEDAMEHLWTIDPHSEDLEEMFSHWQKLQIESCANFLRHPRVLEDMKSRKFDVAIAEPLAVCGLGFFKKLGVEKVILSSSCVHFDFTFRFIGEPDPFSYVPALMSGFGEKMNLFDRFKNIRLKNAHDKVINNFFDKEMEMYRTMLGEDLPDWRELFPAASLYFTNSNPYLDFPRPIIQKTVAIGGISVNMENIRSQKVDKEWDEILKLKRRTMLISFGSITKSSQMPLPWRKNILDVIKSLPDVTFIWKYESNDTNWAAGVENVHFSKWVPQTALLADDRVTAFLTHGGLGSTNELAHCGKPALMVPLFADQVRNANMMARHHGAIVISKFELADREIIGNAIRKILYDQSYHENAKKLADLLQNQPVKPKELVAKYTNFVANYGPFPQMDPYSRHLNFIQKNYIDIYAAIASAYVVVFLLACFIVRFLFSKVSVQLKMSTTKKAKNQ